MAENEKIINEGDVVKINGVEMECSFVSYQEIDGNKMNFTYSFRPHEDMERERKETAVPQADNQGQEA
jgi:hypothetical protein